MEMNDEEKVKVEKETPERETLQAGQKTEKESSSKIFSILSLCFGILSLITCGFFLIPEILGIVFACCSKKHTKMSGMAKAGLICSIISVVMCIGFIAILGSNSSTSEPSSSTEVVTEAEDTEEITTTEVTTEETVPTMDETVKEKPIHNINLPQENLYFSEYGELRLFILIEDLDQVNGTFRITTSGEELGEPNNGYTVTELMKPVENEDSIFISESGRFKMDISEDGSIFYIEDSGDGYLIDGSFSLYENISNTQQSVEEEAITLSPSELKNFARNDNNIGTLVAINGGTVSDPRVNSITMQVMDGYDSIFINLNMDEVSTSLMYNDNINIVGYFTGINNRGQIMVDVISVEIIN